MFTGKTYQLLIGKQLLMPSPDIRSVIWISWRPDWVFTHINSSGKTNVNAGYAKSNAGAGA